MAQHRRAHTALVEELSLVPSTHVRQLITVTSGDPKPLAPTGNIIHVHTPTQIYINKDKSFFKSISTKTQTKEIL